MHPAEKEEGKKDIRCLIEFHTGAVLRLIPHKETIKSAGRMSEGIRALKLVG